MILLEISIFAFDKGDTVQKDLYLGGTANDPIKVIVESGSSGSATFKYIVLFSAVALLSFVIFRLSTKKSREK